MRSEPVQVRHGYRVGGGEGGVHAVFQTEDGVGRRGSGAVERSVRVVEKRDLRFYQLCQQGTL
jgi:hypothetical protein